MFFWNSTQVNATEACFGSTKSIETDNETFFSACLLLGAYYRFVASRPGPYFQGRPVDLNMVFQRIAASAKGASCVFQCKFATAYGFYVAVAAFS